MARNNYANANRNRAIGTTRTIAALREIGEHVLEAAKTEVKRGADIVVADAKSRCPVKTGKLRDSIMAKSNKDGSSFKVTADAVSNGYHYAKTVEYSPKINKPFFYPAMDAHRQEIYDNISAAISKAATRSL